MIIWMIEIVEILSWFQFYQKRTNIPDIDALMLVRKIFAFEIWLRKFVDKSHV